MENDYIEFVSFGIDPGKNSGWALALNAELPIEFGTGNTVKERIQACIRAKKLSKQLSLPLVVSAEGWTMGGGKINRKAIIGLGARFGRWADWIELILGIHEDFILRPVPQTWRNELFGHDMVSPRNSTELKQLACAYMSPPGATPVVDDNVAEAGCIACWAHCSFTGVEAAMVAAKRLQRTKSIGE